MTQYAAGMTQRAFRSPTVSAGLAHGLQQYAVAIGQSPAQVQAAFGRHARYLSEPDYRIPCADYDRAFVQLAAQGDEALFGLQFGAASRLADLGVLGFVLLSSATLGEALRAYQQYQRALGETLQLDLQVQGAQARLNLLPVDPSAAQPHRIEAMVAAVHVLIAELCGRALTWQAVYLPHLDGSASSARRAQAAARLLGCAPQVGAAALVFAATALDQAVRPSGADASLAAALHAHMQRRLQALPSEGVATRAGAALRRRIKHCEQPSLGDIASDLAMSPRALQAQLQVEGQSFRALADLIRQETAEFFLLRGATTREVATLLGFSEEAAFSRAFKRWAGLPPDTWRRQAAPAQ